MSAVLIFFYFKCKKLIKYLINDNLVFFTNKIDVNWENIYVRAETVSSHYFT